MSPRRKAGTSASRIEGSGSVGPKDTSSSYSGTSGSHHQSSRQTVSSSNTSQHQEHHRTTPSSARRVFDTSFIASNHPLDQGANPASIRAVRSNTFLRRDRTTTDCSAKLCREVAASAAFGHRVPSSNVNTASITRPTKLTEVELSLWECLHPRQSTTDDPTMTFKEPRPLFRIELKLGVVEVWLTTLRRNPQALARSVVPESMARWKRSSKRAN
ncbi:uncharacterized protein LOC124310695 [Daphnia pulicaria]|uniref:uncharacterized protein LOC124310695 n=1 Tax=Daphnia pulicaria TaxID=35523 RepID=UPI001EEBFA49|nr:uncharacterized protein LOC124310695 [Daphnia pulicaria]